MLPSDFGIDCATVGLSLEVNTPTTPLSEKRTLSAIEVQIFREETLQRHIPSVQIQASRAASAATCPAKLVTNALKLVIAECSPYSPLLAAVRGDVIKAAVV